MSSSLPEIIADFMSIHAGIVWPLGDNTIEYLAPKDLAAALEISELGRFGFVRSQENDNTVYASYGSDVIAAMHRLLARQGAISAGFFPAPNINVDKFSAKIQKAVYFQNATFHMGDQGTQDVLYDLVFFKYTAVSDDKQEGFVTVLRNSLNGVMSVVSKDVLRSFEDQIQELEEPKPLMLQDIEKSIKLSREAAFVSVKEKTRDFVKSLEKRLNRDVQRVDEYYAQMDQETQKSLLKARGDVKQDIEIRLKAKVEAIANEKKWKIQDVVSKYMLAVSIDPVLVMRVSSKTVVFRLNIQRRQDVRAFALTYNPMLKQLDAMLCEACFLCGWDRSVCDERLHIVCSSCFTVCGVCAKKFCRACFSKGCPRCGGLRPL